MAKRKSHHPSRLIPIGQGKDYLLPLGALDYLLAPIGTLDHWLIPAGSGDDMLRPLGVVMAGDRGVLYRRTAKAAIKRARPINRRQRKFARALADGVPPLRALAIAGFKPHRGNASRLARDPRILAERERIERKRAKMGVA